MPKWVYLEKDSVTTKEGILLLDLVLYRPVYHHFVGDSQKPSNVGTGKQVSACVEFRCRALHLIVDSGNLCLETFVRGLASQAGDESWSSECHGVWCV